MSELFAVILADSYDDNFDRLNNIIPRSLFPFVDDIILEHQLEWLQKNDINEIIILYSHQKIADYINNRKKTKAQNFHLINIQDSKNTGDALRELNSHKIIQYDFILIYGDIITNIKLKDIIAKYMSQKSSDKMNILLMVVHQGLQTYNEEKYLYVLENEDRLCQLTNLQKQKIVFNKERIQLAKGVPNKYKIRTDLIESGIYMCSRDVLKSFEENFMFAEIKDDFMREILTSDIQEEKFHLYITPKTEVSQRIFNPQSYHLANLKYLSKFFYPYGPSQKYYLDFFKYSLGKLDSKSKMSDQCYLGQNSVIKQKTTIIKSIIGKNCKIGEGCEIINSIIWDNVQINDNVVVKDSIITSDMKIKNSISSQILIADQSFNIIDENQQWDDKSDESKSDNPGQQKNTINQNQYTGIQEDMQSLLETCETKDQVAQAIINVDTIKVNKNISFEEIVKTFLSVFLLNLQPDVEQLKNQFLLWEEFFTRFVSETENECYLKTIESFCRSNEQFHLTQFLQLSYKHQIIREQVILNYHQQMENIQNDEFAQKFIQANQQFKDYLESLINEQQQQEQENNEDGDYEYEYVYE